MSTVNFIFLAIVVLSFAIIQAVSIQEDITFSQDIITKKFIKTVVINNQKFQKSPIVPTNDGPVQGIIRYTVDRKIPYYCYSGIPYGEPPIGSLRFKPPVPARKRRHLFNAEKEGSACTQGFPEVRGNEDCLDLNIYTPKLPTKNNPSPKLAVLIWIYGGGWINGSASIVQYGPDFFIDETIIVAMMNYRLGIFGFISTEDLAAPGNNGLRDQNLAIKWIKDNIRHFGGDPERITIWGESAGAASVSYHLQSPRSRGLFHRAIMDSGTTLCLWALSRLSKLAAFTTGLTFGIITDNSTVLVNSLRRINYRELQFNSLVVYILIFYLVNPLDGLIYAPVREPEHPDAFFTGKSYELLRHGEFIHVPCIIGYNSLEGAAFLPLLPIIYLQRYEIVQSGLIPIDMNIKNFLTLALVGITIKNEYWGDQDIGPDIRTTAHFVSDDQFLRPIYETVFLQSQYNRIYTYDFAYVGLLGNVLHPLIPGVVIHAEELNYFWNENLRSTRRDRRVRKRVVTLWTNFVKYGNPTPRREALFNYVTWIPNEHLQDNNLHVLKITSKLENKRSPDYRRRRFWNDLYGLFGNPPYDTY